MRVGPEGGGGSSVFASWTWWAPRASLSGDPDLACMGDLGTWGFHLQTTDSRERGLTLVAFCRDKPSTGASQPVPSAIGSAEVAAWVDAPWSVQAMGPGWGFRAVSGRMGAHGRHRGLSEATAEKSRSRLRRRHLEKWVVFSCQRPGGGLEVGQSFERSSAQDCPRLPGIKTESKG